MILAVLGGLIGLAGAVGYAALMLRLLAALWPEGSVGSFLDAARQRRRAWRSATSAALVVSGLTIWWAVRVLSRVAPERAARRRHAAR